MLDKIKNLLTDKNKELIKIYQNKKPSFHYVENVEHFLRENNYNHYSHSEIQHHGLGTKEDSIVIHDNNFFSIEFNLHNKKLLIPLIRIINLTLPMKVL